MLQPAVQINPAEASEGNEFQSGAYSMNERRMYQPDKERKSVIKELLKKMNQLYYLDNIAGSFSL